MRPNKTLLTEKDVLIFLKNHVNEQLDNKEMDGWELYYDDAYLLSRAGDLLTELINEYSSLKSTASTESTESTESTASTESTDQPEVIRNSDGDWIVKLR